MFETYQSTHPWFTVKAGHAEWDPVGVCCVRDVFNSK